eukprot:CAMPEP_0196658538 /NCGR_PEP_ID=MMETSP1086-20130531/30231_1 /TAXON_ID=77921 /ORGANISM="Cyanoptyche  gloeocystis , Strain SAG4.97" /LENGTH=30 /DNA_ID= /DNA_START= /DNA_END= /DNA_ORIENTATION=
MIMMHSGNQGSQKQPTRAKTAEAVRPCLVL